MNQANNVRLAENRLGRIYLHLKCLVRGGKWSWHLAGLRREIFCRAEVLLVLFLGVGATLNCAAENPPGYYSESFRPQFHFTPEKNWMNDPNGMVYYEGEYHLFYQYNPFGDKWGHMSWGHAVSPDMLHWKHLPLALPEENNVMVFSGSAVVDWKNTSGFGKDGKPPMIAIYTGHHTDKPLQNQNIAYSNDRGRTWTKYSGNPVLDIGKADFRDPKVFWYEKNHRWIMVVSNPQEKKAQFYGSPNLKEWQLLGDFGPAGATKGIWECPDLFPMAVNGNTNEIKWVLIVNMNPGSPAGGSGCQYFVGQFDGEKFTLDPSYPKPIAVGERRAEKILADFEQTNYGDWKITGTAFSAGPSHPGSGVGGYVGSGVADSFGGGDEHEGMLTSPPFNIDANFISFLIGGGSHPGQTGINLLINGKVVRTATGNNSAQLEKQSWDVHELLGQNAQLEIFDHYAGNDWGHIILDQVVLSDEPVGGTAEPALWMDYGRDFYAGVTWSDVPAKDGRRILLGWMSNWDYGQDVPTSPWRSAMTVPRVLFLQRTAEGLRLLQTPVAELEGLRTGSSWIFQGGSFAEASDWLAKQTNLPALLDVEISLSNVSTKSSFTLSLHIGEKEKATVGFDAERRELVIDRTQSGVVGFHKDFPGRQVAPIHVTDGHYKMRLLLDASSLEVFAQNGETVMTDVLFPVGNSRSINLRADGADVPKISGIAIYPLGSAWSSQKHFP